MFERVTRLLDQARERIAAASAADLQALKSELLGRKSELKGLLKSVATLAAEERPRFGAAVNSAAQEIERLIAERLAALASGGPVAAASDIKLPAVLPPSGADFTRPGFARQPGLPHPLQTTIDRICEIFVRLGYGIAEGPDVEDDLHNFTDLNFPQDHPARDAQDTFFMAPARRENPYLLRTHTSPVQIHVMSALAPPLAIVIPGRTYRKDEPDATHSPIFHQVEGLAVGPKITMADLKGTLDYFAKELFGPEFKTRFRPSFFPFTEPSAEVDVSCMACMGRGDAHCRICKGTGFLEILGAGMVDPNVFEAICRRRGDRVYDPEKVTGFAFGMGVERVAMLSYGIDDLRNFFDNDPRFLGMLA